MNGKKKINTSTLNHLFEIQLETQRKLIDKGVYDKFKDTFTYNVPVDDVGICSYQIQQLMSEVGEVLDADKRWKSHRNEDYDKVHKLEEIADCFVVLMNIAMYSGFDGDEVATAIEDKLKVVSDRLTKI